MTETTSLTASPDAANKKKLLVAGNIAMWAFQGLYTVSPIDLIPDILPLVGLMDDMVGLMVTVAFTLYTLNVLRRHGVGGLMSGGEAEDRDTDTIDVEPDRPRSPLDADDLGIAGYEPVSFRDIDDL